MRKTRLQIIDGSLFLYGAIVTCFLTITAVFNLNSRYSLILFLLVLPVSIYFLTQIYFSAKQLLQNLLNLDRQKNPHYGSFSLTTFINQSETTFLINLFLLCFAIALILFRISIQIIQ